MNIYDLFSLAIHLELPTLLKFCSVNKYLKRNLCGKDEIWIHKLNKDFPNYKNLHVKNKNKNKKEIYQLLYSLSKLKRELKIEKDIKFSFKFTK